MNKSTECIQTNFFVILKFKIYRVIQKSEFNKSSIYQLVRLLFQSTSTFQPLIRDFQLYRRDENTRKHDDDRDILGQRCRKGATGHGRKPESLSLPLFTFIFPFPFFFFLLQRCQPPSVFPFAISRGTLPIKRHNLQLLINAILLYAFYRFQFDVTGIHSKYFCSHMRNNFL